MAPFLSMSPDPQPRNPDGDPLEDSELARRLRKMDWPAAPGDVKERCLQQILTRVEPGGGVADSAVAGDEAPPPVA